MVVPTTAAELRAALASALNLEVADIGDNDNLVGLGLDSIATMTMLGDWQSTGLDVSYAELADEPTVTGWWHVLVRAGGEAQPVTRLSLPEPVDPAQPFALTPVQYAYWMGRKAGQVLGGIACHGYFEFDAGPVSADRLERAMRAVVARHGMLRAQVNQDGTQQILDSSPWTGLIRHELAGLTTAETVQRLETIRTASSHRVLDIEGGEVFALQLSRLASGSRLHLNIDLLVADVLSIQILLADLAEAYRLDTPLAPLRQDFAGYLAERRANTGPAESRARSYWTDRLDELPVGGPGLSTLVEPAQIGRPVFRRRSHQLEPPAWQALQRRCAEHHLTPSIVLATAFAAVLGRWSSRDEFLLNVPLFDRRGTHPDTGRIIADFTNLLLLQVDTSGDRSFAERARQMQLRFAADVSHAEYSAVDVLRDLSRHRGEPVSAPVVFASSLGGEFVDEGFRACFGDLGWMLSQTPQVWLDHQLYERAGCLLLCWDSVDELLGADRVEVMFAAYRRLVEWLAAIDTDWSATMPDLLPADQAEVRFRVNNTGGPLPNELLQDGFVRQALDEPDRVAVLAADGTCSYGRLLARANGVADALGERGIRPGELVGIRLPKSTDQIAAVLGVLLAGGVYLPIDDNQPIARQIRILTDAGARLVVTGSERPDPRWPVTISHLAVASLPDGTPVARPPRRRPDELAYVIYTSGSTGTPKGVMVSHRSAANTIDDLNGRYSVRARDRVLGLANLSFDLSVYDIFGPLSVGAALVLPDPSRRGDPSHWAELIVRHRVSIWNSVPAQLQMLDQYLDFGEEDGQLDSLRLAMLSGDWIPVGLPDSIRSKLPELQLRSLGGATEAAIWSIEFPIEEVDPDWRSIPYGRALRNQSMHVLDCELRPSPDHVIGEIHIGGVGVALGYLNDPVRTAERFLTHPRSGERLYRTGDLGRCRPDGTIEFLGRADSQVKIRGHRIELAEIEHALLGHPGVAAAHLVVDGDRGGHQRLVGFVEPARRAEPPNFEPDQEGPVLSAAAGAAGESVRRGGQAVAEFQARLDRAALLSMARALRQCGAFASATARHRPEEVIARIGADPQHHWLVRRWLSSLSVEGLLEADPDGRFHRLTETDPEPAWEAVAALAADGIYPIERIRYLRESASVLPQLLRGEIDQLRVFFPDGDFGYASATFTDNEIARYLNRSMAGFARELSERREPLRILEVGAGIAGSTAEILAALVGRSVEYHFTDVSPFFLNQARERFAERPELRFHLYDLNRDPIEQGLRPNGFDLILSANVLHNARHVGRTLAHLRTLLAPGGWLLTLDGVKENYDLLVSMAFLIKLDSPDGDFEDFRHGADRMFLSEAEWRSELAAAGGRVEFCLPPTEDSLSGLGERLIAAQFKTEQARLSEVTLTGHLAGRLPEYMVPAEFFLLDRIPLSGNGKIDSNRMRSWLRTDPDHSANTVLAPDGPLETALARIWSEVLALTAVGRNQNFYELGGDSLVITRLIGRLRAEIPELAGRDFDELLRLLLLDPTVAGLAASLRPAC